MLRRNGSYRHCAKEASYSRPLDAVLRCLARSWVGSNESGGFEEDDDDYDDDLLERKKVLTEAKFLLRLPIIADAEMEAVSIDT
jgi:hypothetical protein